jgi:hypothetical protein
MFQTDIFDRYSSMPMFWSLEPLDFGHCFEISAAASLRAVLRISDLSKPPMGVPPLELALRLQSHRLNGWLLYFMKGFECRTKVKECTKKSKYR